MWRTTLLVGTFALSVLQCVAVCCSVLQGVSGCCRVLQGVAVCCSVLQCVAGCCSKLQYVCRLGWPSLQGYKGNHATIQGMSLQHTATH